MTKQQQMFTNYTLILYKLIKRHIIFSELWDLKYKDKLKKNDWLWIVILDSLQSQIIIIIYDLFSTKKATINVNNILKNITDRTCKSKAQDIIENNKLLENIKKWRHNICAHNNNNSITQPGMKKNECFENKFPVTNTDIKLLLDDLIAFADCVGRCFYPNSNINYRKDYYDSEHQFLKDKVGCFLKKL